MSEVIAAMLPAPELIYFYSQMNYHLMEVGQKPTIDRAGDDITD